MLSQEQYRQNVYKILKGLQAGKLSMSQAQRKIVRGARRLAKGEEIKAEVVTCPVCGDKSGDCLHTIENEIQEDPRIQKYAEKD